jgi:hypothetical protein
VKGLWLILQFWYLSATGSELSTEGEQNLTPARRITSSWGKTSSSISS